MQKAHRGLGVDVWLNNVREYSMKVYVTPYAKEEMTKEDREMLYEIFVRAKYLHKKYVEE